MTNSTTNFESHLKKHRVGKKSLSSLSDEIGLAAVYIIDIENFQNRQ